MTADHTMKLRLPSISGRQHQRFELSRGEIQRLEATGLRMRIRVLSGSAWVTANGQDMIVKRGAVLQLPPSKESIVISSLNNTAVVYEIH